MLDRLVGELSKTDDNGLPYMYNKVATVAVVGNEDGAHKVSADLFERLARNAAHLARLLRDSPYPA